MFLNDFDENCTIYQSETDKAKVFCPLVNPPITHISLKKSLHIENELNSSTQEDVKLRTNSLKNVT